MYIFGEKIVHFVWRKLSRKLPMEIKLQISRMVTQYRESSRLIFTINNSMNFFKVQEISLCIMYYYSYFWWWDNHKEILLLFPLLTHITVREVFQ